MSMVKERNRGVAKPPEEIHAPQSLYRSYASEHQDQVKSEFEI